MQALIHTVRDRDAVQQIVQFLSNPKNRDSRFSVSDVEAVDAASILDREPLLRIVEQLGIQNLLNSSDPEQLKSLVSLLDTYMGKIHLSKELAFKQKLNESAQEVIRFSKSTLESIQTLFNAEREPLFSIEYTHYKSAVNRLITFLDAVPRKPKSGEIFAVMGKLVPENAQNQTNISSKHAVVITPDSDESAVQMMPTKEAWETGCVLADTLIEQKVEMTGAYPRKVVINIWGGEFKRSKGRNLAECLYLIGVEPVWDKDGVVCDIRRIPLQKLKRPRIDVLVQTSGMFRDIGASRIDLINKAVKAVTCIEDEISGDNYVRKSSLMAEQIMLEQGCSPEEAKEFSTIRTVGAIPGTYGTGIIPLVENGNQWESKSKVAETYLNYMGVVYTRKHWGVQKQGVLEALLHDADTIVQPLSNRKCGPLNLDHIYEYVGGISAAITHVTGFEPDAYINDVRDKKNPQVVSIGRVALEEKTNSFCNPVYLQKVMDGTTASTKTLARTFRNTFGWNVLRPFVLPEGLWMELFSVYVKDANNIGIDAFFEKVNPHGFQEITGILLEAARKKFWLPDNEILVSLAIRHANLVGDNELVSNSFVTDNPALITLIKSYLPEPLLTEYANKLNHGGGGRDNPASNQFDHVKEMLGSSMAAMVSVMILVVLLAGAVAVYSRDSKNTPSVTG